jgi:hypothetical protein
MDEKRHKSPLIKKKRLNIEDLEEPIDFVKRYPSKTSAYLIGKANIINYDTDENLRINVITKHM